MLIPLLLTLCAIFKIICNKIVIVKIRIIILILYIFLNLNLIIVVYHVILNVIWLWNVNFIPTT
jgi:hypothetical protein